MTAGTPRPAGADYLERARALAPKVAAAADEIERTRRLPEPLLEALVDAGLFRMLLPRSLGGGELAPASYAAVIEEVARTDASTAWVLGQTSGCSMSAAYLDPTVARRIFGDRRAILAWGPGPDARAVAVPGGWRISGTWTFASGGRHATWLGGYCPIVEPDGTPRRSPDGSAEGRTMLFPASEATWHDVWDVIGLRGTGSDSYSVSDLFVPADHSLARDEAAERREPGPLYLFTANNLFASAFASVALGIARAFIDGFVDLARGKVPRGATRPIRDNAVVQAEVARAEARVRSARAFLFGSLHEIWDEVVRTGTLRLDQRVTIRLAATHAIHQACRAVDALYHAAGATVIFAAAGFERRFRDLHTVAQQVQGRQAHFESVGRFLLGLEPDTTWL